MYGKAWQLTQQITRSATWKFPQDKLMQPWLIHNLRILGALSYSRDEQRRRTFSEVSINHIWRELDLCLCVGFKRMTFPDTFAVSNRSLLCDLVVRDWREPHPACFNAKGMAPSFCEDGHKSAQPICWSCCRRNFVMFVWSLKVKRCQKSLWGPVFF